MYLRFDNIFIHFAHLLQFSPVSHHTGCSCFEFYIQISFPPDTRRNMLTDFQQWEEAQKQIRSKSGDEDEKEWKKKKIKRYSLPIRSTSPIESPSPTVTPKPLAAPLTPTSRRVQFATPRVAESEKIVSDDDSVHRSFSSPRGHPFMGEQTPPPPQLKSSTSPRHVVTTSDPHPAILKLARVGESPEVSTDDHSAEDSPQPTAKLERSGSMRKSHSSESVLVTLTRSNPLLDVSPKESDSYRKIQSPSRQDLQKVKRENTDLLAASPPSSQAASKKSKRLSESSNRAKKEKERERERRDKRRSIQFDSKTSPHMILTSPTAFHHIVAHLFGRPISQLNGHMSLFANELG